MFAASAIYLAEYAKVLKKFPVNRIGKSLAPPPPAVQAVAQDDDDDIGFRLRFEEDDKMIPDPVHSQDPEPAVEQQDSTEKVAGEVTGTESGRPVTEPETPVSENKTPGFEHETPVPEREIPVPENTTHGAESRTQVTESETQVTENETPRRVSLNDRFSEQKSTLYERIAPAKEQQQSSQNPVTNLGRSIGINERYYFIKALFQDDKVAFDQAITRSEEHQSEHQSLMRISYAAIS